MGVCNSLHVCVTVCMYKMGLCIDGSGLFTCATSSRGH